MINHGYFLIKKIIILLVFSLVLLSCKDIQCSAFPEKLKDYMPYSKGDILLFSNENNDTLRLNVIEDTSSKSYSFPGNCDCECDVNTKFKTDIDTIYSIQITGTIQLFDDFSYIESSVINNYFRREISDVNPFLSENSNLFGDTVVMNEFSSNTRIKNLKIIRTKGIVSFYDDEIKCNWVKIE